MRSSVYRPSYSVNQRIQRKNPFLQLSYTDAAKEADAFDLEFTSNRISLHVPVLKLLFHLHLSLQHQRTTPRTQSWF